MPESAPLGFEFTDGSRRSTGAAPNPKLPAPPARVPWVVLGLAVAFALVLAVPGQTVTTKYLNDLFIFLDGAHRIMAGQVPNRDFHSALGPLAFYIPAAGYWLSGSLGGAMPVGTLPPPPPEPVEEPSTVEAVVETVTDTAAGLTPTADADSGLGPLPGRELAGALLVGATLVAVRPTRRRPQPAR